MFKWWGNFKFSYLKTDLTIAAIVDIPGLKPAFNSIGKTKVLALANKEAIVCSEIFLWKR